MKTITEKYLPILILLIASVTMSSFAFAKNESNNLDHASLAVQYENLAREMKAKVEHQKDIIKNKPRSSYFGRNGQHIKKRVMSRIRKYEKAAIENLAKANFHTRNTAESGKTYEQTNKVKEKLNREQSL